jgi:hypothetical protein
MASKDTPAEVTESAKKQAEDVSKAYDEGPTAVLPGPHGTISGTAINDWLEENGQPKYGKDEPPQG